VLKWASKGKIFGDLLVMSFFFFRAPGGNQPTGVRSGILIPEPPCKTELLIPERCQRHKTEDQKDVSQYKDILWKDLDTALKDALHLSKTHGVFPRLGTLLSKDAQRRTGRFPDKLYSQKRFNVQTPDPPSPLREEADSPL